MISFIKKHPKLLAISIFLLVKVNGFLLSVLNSLMLKLILLKDKDPNFVPVPPAPEPVVEISLPRAVLNIPYTPSWVADSFRNPRKHPLFGGVIASPPPYLKKDPPATVVEVSTSGSPTIVSDEVTSSNESLTTEK